MKKGIVLSLVLCLAFTLNAKYEISVPWNCSFEDSTENALWVLNAGSKGALCQDTWYISNLESYDGVNSLHISCDTLQNARYGSKPNMVVVYRDILLPKGEYDISFDWKAKPVINAGGIYAYFHPLSMLSPPNVGKDSIVSDHESDDLPSWNIKQMFPNATYPEKQSTAWTNSSFRVKVPRVDMPMRLYFLWQNNNTDSLNPDPFGACIDNVQINSTFCQKPISIDAEAQCDTIDISWVSYSEEYQLEFRNKKSKIWNRVNLGNETKYQVTGIAEGVYDVRVRGICGQDTSGWVTKSNILSYCPENHCINYVDIYSENVTCYVGRATSTDYYKDYEGHAIWIGDLGSPVYSDSLTSGPIDFGQDHVRSRHTVNWTPKFDPRTDRKLKTIPDSEFASVRLGNWEGGGLAERIEFDYQVDSASSILLLRYAIVLEDVSHPRHQQPAFFLDILRKTVDQLGDVHYELINPTCGAVQFYADMEAEGWNAFGLNAWKDWTTMGLNLKDYVGDDLVIRLSTRDCVFVAHFGYAYFTLGCTSGEIKGVSCGDSPFMEISAPDGFNYLWSNDNDSTFEATTQIISVPSQDESVYRCRVSYVGLDSCFFELSTVVKPRIPYADFTYETIRENCETKLIFTDNSHVQTKEDGKLVSTKELAQYREWDLGNGTISSMSEVVVTIPKEGGKVEVRLTASISDGACVDDTVFMIDIAPLLEYHDTVKKEICFGEIEFFGDQILGTSGTYTNNMKTAAGCDSVEILELTVYDFISDFETFDTACFGEPYVHPANGKTYTEAKKYKIWHKSYHGCDSVEAFNLYFYPEVTFNYSKSDVKDLPNSGSITITDAPDNYYYELNGDKDAPLDGLDAGDYTLVVYNQKRCPSDTVKITIEQDCLEIDTEIGDVTVCSGEEEIIVPIAVIDGVASTYSIIYDTKALSAGFVNQENETLLESVSIKLPELCRPNDYEVVIAVHDVLCEDIEIPINITVLYPSSIMTQKWNDVIALLSKEYNGGYVFSSYEWFRNGVVLPFEDNDSTHGPYLYLNGENFQLNDEYSVALTRADDGVRMMSCTMQPILKNDTHEYPTRTVANVSEKIRLENVSGNAKVTWYDCLGKIYSQHEVNDGDTEISVPSVAGFYIVEIVTENGRNVYKMWVKG